MNLLEWVKDNKGKAIALGIAFFYLIGASFLEGAKGFFRILLFLILPLGCIFFSDALGSYTGFSRPLGPRVTKTTPGCFIALIGWVLLLFPLLSVIWFMLFAGRGK
jgi:hypothetical protein